MKSTHVVIDGVEQNIYKNPKTDKSGVKKSLVGRCVVIKNDEGNIEVLDNMSIEESNLYDNKNMLRTVFLNGKLVVDDTFSNIRERINKQIVSLTK